MYGEKLKGGSLKVKGKAARIAGGRGGGGIFMGDFTRKVFYQNYLPILASFDLKKVL